jgi:DnaK suppressor protein
MNAGAGAGTPPGVRAALAAEQQATLEQVAGLEREFAQIVAASQADNADDEHDPEGATIAFERQHVAALLAQAREHLTAIEAALARLDAGAYGYCERCGQPISPERLAARPTATRCIACASTGRLAGPDRSRLMEVGPPAGAGAQPQGDAAGAAVTLFADVGDDDGRAGEPDRLQAGGRPRRQVAVRGRGQHGDELRPGETAAVRHDLGEIRVEQSLQVGAARIRRQQAQFVGQDGSHIRIGRGLGHRLTIAATKGSAGCSCGMLSWATSRPTCGCGVIRNHWVINPVADLA